MKPVVKRSFFAFPCAQCRELSKHVRRVFGRFVVVNAVFAEIAGGRQIPQCSPGGNMRMERGSGRAMRRVRWRRQFRFSSALYGNEQKPAPTCGTPKSAAATT